MSKIFVKISCIININQLALSKQKRNKIMEEIWKPIRMYEGIYEISNNKRIKRLPVVVHRNSHSYSLKERILKTNSDDVSLIKDGKRKTYDINTLYHIHFKGFIRKGDRKQNILSSKVVSRRRLIQDNCSALPNKTSRYVGVSWKQKDKRWTTSITINTNSIYLGNFEDEDEAHLMYKKACKYDYLYKGSPKLFRDMLKKTIL